MRAERPGRSSACCRCRSLTPPPAQEVEDTTGSGMVMPVTSVAGERGRANGDLDQRPAKLHGNQRARPDRGMPKGKPVVVAVGVVTDVGWGNVQAGGG